MPIFTPRKHLSGIFLYNPEGKILVIHRNTSEMQWWEIIGGKVKPDETSRKAATRESREEANILVATVGRNALYSYEFEYGNQLFVQDVWRARLVSGNPQPLEPGHDAVAWMGVPELRRHEDVSPGLEYLIKQLVDGEVRISV